MSLEILSIKQMITCEQETVEETQLNFLDLKQHAGQAVIDFILDNYKIQSTLVLCGPGDNGGDGFRIAKGLLDLGWPVVVATHEPTNASQEYADCKSLWTGKTIAYNQLQLDCFDLAIDALFGLGLTKPITGIYQQVINALNNAVLNVVAVDIPSGISADSGQILGTAVIADHTVTFGYQKIGHVLLPGKFFSGQIHIANIGLNKPKQATAVTNDPSLWIDKFPAPCVFDHKYTRGHVLIYGGATITGAPRLSALCARRVGAGLTSIACLEQSFQIYAAQNIGNLIHPLVQQQDFLALIEKFKVSVLLLGPGMLPDQQTRDIVLKCLDLKKPCVLDAGALSAFVNNQELLLHQLHEQCVITPHQSEFERLFNFDGNKVDQAKQAAKATNCTVILKGNDTVIANANNAVTVIQKEASPYLATAGTGDCLAGLVAGLVAQTKDPFFSACAGQWILCEAAGQFGPGLIAEDIPALIPDILVNILAETGTKDRITSL